MKRGGGQKIIHTPQNILEGNGVVFEILVKEKDPPPSFRTFMQKTNYSYPSNILGGNRVVFETLVKKRSPIIKKISWKEGGSKNIIHTPSKYS